MMEDILNSLNSLSNPCIVSADENEESDVKEFSKDWNFPYVNVPLPKWNVRADHPIHVKVVKAKKENTLICDGVQCDFKVLHSIKVDDKTAERGGAHCALSDTVELLHFIHDRNLHSLISRASRDSWHSHLSMGEK